MSGEGEGGRPISDDAAMANNPKASSEQSWLLAVSSGQHGAAAGAYCWRFPVGRQGVAASDGMKSRRERERERVHGERGREESRERILGERECFRREKVVS